MYRCCPSVCLFVCLSVAKMLKTRFYQKQSNLKLWSLLTSYRKSCRGFSKNLLLDPYNPTWLRFAILKINMTSSFSDEGGPISIKFRRLVQNDMSTAVIWSKSKPDVEFQYGERLGEFHGMSSQSHMLHCRVQSPGEINVSNFNVMIVLHCRIIIPSAILKIVFRHIFNAVWALTSGGFGIVSDTLVTNKVTTFQSYEYRCKHT